MTLPKILKLSILTTLRVSCAFVTETFHLSNRAADTQAGVYACSGHEFGMLAFAGCLDLHQDGRFTFNKQQGRFTYDSKDALVIFDEKSILDQAEILEDGQSLIVYLKEGEQLVHAESGFMQCTRIETDACPGW